MSGSLIYEQETDYRLKDEAVSCWVTVKNLSVHIVRTDEGVAIDIYPRGEEMNDSIAGTWALFQEAEGV